MSGAGAPPNVAMVQEALTETFSENATLEQVLTHHRVAIVASRWHDQVMSGLIAGAQNLAQECGVPATLYRVPGSFELPALAAELAKSGKYDAVVALGVVIRGGTPHFEYVCEAVTTGLTEVSVTQRFPVGFGVLTCDTEQQALDRAGLPDSQEDKGGEAAAAALAVAVTLAGIRGKAH